MKTLVHPQRDFQALEDRRRRAAKLFRAGARLASVARTFQVSRQSVSRWYRPWKQGTAEALHAAERAGRKAKLERPQLQQLDGALRPGARAQGFGTDRWTLPRVAKRIERLTGVRYHPGHFGKILCALNWTLQRPTRRARERPAAAGRQWVEERWRAVKKTLGDPAPGSSSRTKAASANVPPPAAPGRPAAKPRPGFTPSTGRSSRLARPWPIVGRATAPASISRRVPIITTPRAGGLSSRTGGGLGAANPPP